MYLNYTYQFAINYVWGYPTTLRSVDYLISHKARIWNLNQPECHRNAMLHVFFVSEKSGKLANLGKMFPYALSSPGPIWVFPKIRGTRKWMVYNGKPY